jgi:hypothetical protein
MKKNLMIRGLKKIDFTVLCVDSGQKTYYDTVSGRSLPYSSGQQIKKSIMNNIYDSSEYFPSPLIFWHNAEGAKLTQGEVIPKCDPRYIDQLLAGYMAAAAKTDGEQEAVLKSKAHFAVSAMTPFHSKLAGLVEEKVIINKIDNPVYKLRKVEKKGDNVELSESEIIEFLNANNQRFSSIKLIPLKSGDRAHNRANGIFKYDVDIDLERLFRVSVSLGSNEINSKIEGELKAAGWKEVTIKNITYLEMPKEFHDEYAGLIAHAVFNWKITSNNSRTYDNMATFAAAICTDAKEVQICMQYEPSIDDDNKLEKGIALDGGGNGTKIFLEKFALEYLNISFNPDEVTPKNRAITDAEQYVKEAILEYYK